MEGVQGLTTSASSLASEQLEESLSAASLAEVGSDWQLAVDSLTSSMDSSVGVQPLSLPSLSSSRPPDQLAVDVEEEEQVTGQCAPILHSPISCVNCRLHINRGLVQSSLPPDVLSLSLSLSDQTSNHALIPETICHYSPSELNAVM